MADGRWQQEWMGKFEDHASQENYVMREVAELRDNNNRQADQLLQQEDRMEVIEERLLIIARELEMEDLYPELKEAHDNYRRIVEKYKIFEELKKPY